MNNLKSRISTILLRPPVFLTLCFAAGYLTCLTTVMIFRNFSVRPLRIPEPAKSTVEAPKQYQDTYSVPLPVYPTPAPMMIEIQKDASSSATK